MISYNIYKTYSHSEKKTMETNKKHPKNERRCRDVKTKKAFEQG